jgi:hypothetical protein
MKLARSDKIFRIRGDSFLKDYHTEPISDMSDGKTAYIRRIETQFELNFPLHSMNLCIENHLI